MKRIIYIILLLVLAGVAYGLYLFYKKPADAREMSPDYEMTAADLVRAFTDHEDDANKKYVDKVMVVSGKVSQVDMPTVTVFLDAGDPMAAVTCSFYADESSSLTSLKPGDAVSIKGKCTGKLADVVLNNCSLYKKN